MIVPTPKAETIVHALELVTAAHKARLSEPSLMAAEKIAREEGASRAQLQLAVARGLQAVLLCLLLARCTPAKAAGTPPADTPAARAALIETVIMTPGASLPGLRHMGVSQGAELWSDGEMWIRVRRVGQ